MLFTLTEKFMFIFNIRKQFEIYLSQKKVYCEVFFFLYVTHLANFLSLTNLILFL